MKLVRLLKSKRSHILKLAARHGARNVRVFGSVARGDVNEQSDIDFLIDLDPGRSILDHAALILDLQHLLNCRVDVVTERGLRPKIRKRVVKEAVPL